MHITSEPCSCGRDRIGWKPASARCLAIHQYGRIFPLIPSSIHVATIRLAVSYRGHTSCHTALRCRDMAADAARPNTTAIHRQQIAAPQVKPMDPISRMVQEIWPHLYHLDRPAANGHHLRPGRGNGAHGIPEQQVLFSATNGCHG